MRILLLAVTLVLAAGALAQPATEAKSWPSRAIRLIVPFPPGSSPDLIARILAEKLAPFRERRKELEAKPERVREALRYGEEKARAIASRTMSEVREAMKLP